MPDKPHIIALYAAGASVAAVTLYYILGPTLFPDEEATFGAKCNGAVGLSNPANDCFINSVLQALAGLEELRGFLGQDLYAGQKDDYIQTGEEISPDDERKSREDDGILQVCMVTSALKNILDRLNERPRYRRTISAQDFIRSLEFAFRKGLSRRQQDAQEFLQLVAERVCDEYHKSVKLQGNARRVMSSEPRSHGMAAQDTNGPSSGDEAFGDMAPGPVRSQQDEVISDNKTKPFPLEGRLSSQIQCTTCDYVPSANVSTFVTLTLNVPQLPTTTLNTCLDNLLKVETISDYKCDRCLLLAALSVQQMTLAKQSAPSKLVDTLRDSIAAFEEALKAPDLSAPNRSSEATIEAASTIVTSPPHRTISKHTRISTHPKILCLHLSRSIFAPSSFSTKNTAKVAFQECLGLGGLADRKSYRLVCLVTHRGGHNSGHYETFRRQASAEDAQHVDENSDQTARRLRRAQRQRQRQQDKWWRISDDKIAECRTDDVLSMQKEAYLLFYGRIEG